MDHAVAAALVGVGGALGGAVLGSAGVLISGRQARIHDRWRWVQDKRVDAYTQFGTAWNDLQDGFRYWNQDRSMTRFNSAITAMATARQLVRLVAPDDTAAETDQVLSHAQIAMAHMTGVLKGSPGDADAKMREAWESYKRALDLQKRDLAESQ